MSHSLLSTHKIIHKGSGYIATVLGLVNISLGISFLMALQFDLTLAYAASALYGVFILTICLYWIDNICRAVNAKPKVDTAAANNIVGPLGGL